VDLIDRVSFLKPFKLKAIVDKPKAVNQIPTTGQIAKKKCKERELLKAKKPAYLIVHVFTPKKIFLDFSFI
jgi:hypothetical protein